MIYLTQDDLNLESFERFITESTGGDSSIVDNAEKKAIAHCKTFLSRYDVEDVFDEEEPIRDEHLANIIAIITCYKIISRNAARKVPSDAREDYKWALEQLEKIQTGRVTLELPPRIDSSTGNAVSNAIFGNISNPDFYI
ncbi:MAG: DUF1320 domain-containing protein [Bacteroidia bacterium]|nr:DUF1320 domain-containing protein [Bacteroidia bacterium]